MKPGRRFPTAGVVRAFAAMVIAGTALAKAPEMVLTDKDRGHWSYLPLRSPAVPEVEGAGTGMDGFVLAKLAEKKMTLSPRADAGTLVRRIYFDLIGLPPSPDAVEAFVREHGRDEKAAVAGLVDELLARPQYGERWGRHWRDVARYADSDGSYRLTDVAGEVIDRILV